MRKVKSKGQSPYKKYGKRPYRYSGTYGAWFYSVTKHSKVYNGSSFNTGGKDYAQAA